MKWREGEGNVQLCHLQTKRSPYMIARNFGSHIRVCLKEQETPSLTPMTLRYVRSLLIGSDLRWAKCSEVDSCTSIYSFRGFCVEA
ncbi:hypothetical protein M413DRAFT_248806 [Hebeloma cylindrosporum]|uniref:Uncharacterized protein n=1 Tax=Hebeloma cylindrosporum TaxID=76867 RepID=A0A0C2XKH6_HEBCY|nr:hypothetical protein M413DRAFT_248806 [Hebeloma cylindrosporum h7]